MRKGQIDATRIADGAQVYIKQVKTNARELRLLRFLNRDSVREDPRNHCVPLLDAFQDDEDPSLSYMIMPFLHHIMHEPLPKYAMDAMEIVDQLLEVGTLCNEAVILLKMSRDSCSFTVRTLPIGERTSKMPAISPFTRSRLAIVRT